MDRKRFFFNSGLVCTKGRYKNRERKTTDNQHFSSLFWVVIPLGFEPKTHALEGRCSNPTELRNHLRVQK